MSATTRPAISVLMVCMGNICRSPTAEGVLRHKLRLAALDAHVDVDSAGTHGYHVGDPPDARAQQHARRRGIELSGLRARRVHEADFERFDLLLAMDEDNFGELMRLCPAGREGRVRLLLDFASSAGTGREVPDPYYGGAAGFETVLDLVEDACDGLLVHLRQQLDGTS